MDVRQWRTKTEKFSRHHEQNGTAVVSIIFQEMQKPNGNKKAGWEVRENGKANWSPICRCMHCKPNRTKIVVTFCTTLIGKIIIKLIN